MNQREFEALCKRIQADTVDILVSKGAEYAGSEDRLANFKRGAASTGVEPLTVLHVYMAKHWDSVSSYVRAKQRGEEPKLSEPIIGRFYDLINYAVLAIALIEDGGPKEAQSAPKPLTLELRFADGLDIIEVSGSEAEVLYRSFQLYSAAGTVHGRVKFQDRIVAAWRQVGTKTWMGV